MAPCKCYMEMSPTIQLEKFSGWDSLSAFDRTTIISLVTKNSSALEGTKVDLKEEKTLLQEPSSKSGNKRKKALESDQKLKNSKDGGNSSSIKLPSENNVKNVEGEPSKGSVLESQLEGQTKALWALKVDLRKQATSSELREMLEANDQDSRGSELDLRERRADGMLFGALSKCSLCSEWVVMPHICTDAVDIYQSGVSVLIPPLSLRVSRESGKSPLCSGRSSGSQAVNWPSPASKVESIGDLKIAIAGIPHELMEEWKSKIEEAGGQVHTKIRKETNCLVVSGVLDEIGAETRKARRMKLPVLREDYLIDCIKRRINSLLICTK